MAAITYAYYAYYGGYAVPTQLYQIDLADKALAEIDRIRDMTDAVNRRKLRILAENICRNYLADGSPEDLDAAIVQSYVSNSADTHEPLLALLERLVTPPDPPTESD
jgi:hypothetical protein